MARRAPRAPEIPYADLVRALDLDPERLAIELDRRIVKRAQWTTTVLPAGAHLEIVQFVGGG